ncbi:alpha-N-acetylgalactosaminide alpha-2,6-sialyltransferase 5 [Egretta garzetta]|uniref:alpha-N-acetylgalactosaminide alpha-2,6-sialyltransferase 5 n=1 Tax=Egretta garzetta TaxID=188379 RepID=UPI00163B8D3C|nr:alpha-N-acetylgalactosaminide alpha-2,6-sialyltransferase 5 [Egretta garzetta]
MPWQPREMGVKASGAAGGHGGGSERMAQVTGTESKPAKFTPGDTLARFVMTSIVMLSIVRTSKLPWRATGLDLGVLQPMVCGGLSLAGHQPLKMHCKSCALVTSSGHLLGSKQGDRIDETECVIRMNDAPTRGYGKDVGNKTSLRVIAHSSIQRILRNRNELLNMSHGAVFIFWGPSSYMRRDGKGLVYNNLQLMNQILPQLKAYMISRHKMLQFDDLFKRETGKDRKISNTWLSTGWFTMTIALELCDRINVYGMVPPDFCRDPNHLSVPYHYYEPLGPDECTMYISHERGRKGSHHRFITEKRVFENWARTFNIHFFQPDWKPEPLTVNHPEIKPVA